MQRKPCRDEKAARATTRTACASIVLLTAALVAGIASAPAVSAAATTGMTPDRAYAGAQLLKMSNFPHGWQKSGQTWVGASDEDNSSSMFTITQFPPLSTCMGTSPPFSVTAAEANSVTYNSKDESTNVFDVADVYANADDAKSDFPPLTNPKFASCVVQVEGPAILADEQSEWPSGVTFGTMTASVVDAPKYGNQSGMLEVQVPVNNLPDQQGSTLDFYTVLLIRQGRSTAELFIDQSQVAPPAGLTKTLAQDVTAKMKAPPPPPTVHAKKGVQA